MKSNSLKMLIGNRLGNFSTQMNFGDPRWLRGLSSIPLPKISPVSIGLHIIAKDIFKVCSTNSDKDALALILRELLQFAPSARNIIIVKM